MQKPYYTIQQILAMDLPPIIIYAAPFMFALVFAEWFIRVRKLQMSYDGKDTFAAAAIGIGNVISSALLKGILFAVILFFYNMVPWYIPITWWSFILCFVAIDFFRYWSHRISHEQRMWWATHVTHHSSEQYTLSVSFRLSWTQHLKIIFFIPIALMGFDPFVFFCANQVAVLYQFWIHTELINRMWAPIEYIFVTPSNHRVHHGRDDEYLDRNYGSSLIIWDRIFGTYTQEGHTPDYGILTPVGSYNPIYLVFHEWIEIWDDMKKYRTPRAWWRILFCSPSLKLDKEGFYGNARPLSDLPGLIMEWQENQKEQEEVVAAPAAVSA